MPNERTLPKALKKETKNDRKRDSERDRVLDNDDLRGVVKCVVLAGIPNPLVALSHFQPSSWGAGGFKFSGPSPLVQRNGSTRLISGCAAVRGIP